MTSVVYAVYRCVHDNRIRVTEWYNTTRPPFPFVARYSSMLSTFLIALAISLFPPHNDRGDTFQDGVFDSAEGRVTIKLCGLSATVCDDGDLEVQCRPELSQSFFEKPLAISDGSGPLLQRR